MIHWRALKKLIFLGFISFRQTGIHWEKFGLDIAPKNFINVLLNHIYPTNSISCLFHYLNYSNGNKTEQSVAWDEDFHETTEPWALKTIFAHWKTNWLPFLSIRWWWNSSCNICPGLQSANYLFQSVIQGLKHLAVGYLGPVNLVLDFT